MKWEVNGQGGKIIVAADKVEVGHHLVLSDSHGAVVACFAPGTWYSCIVQEELPGS